MIVAQVDETVQFVTQPDHAALAGKFADHWGSDAVERPSPFASLTIAAYTHDDGWWDYDRRPHLDGDGEPVDFREMPADTWTALYDDGIDSVVDIDRYAGLLVSMHGAGLRNQRYGLSPSWPETPKEFAPFVEQEEKRQRRLFDSLRESDDVDHLTAADERALTALHESGSPPSGTDSRLWAHYKLLQAWDALSLSFCVTTSPPGYETIDAVPTGVGDDVTLSITRVDDGEFRIDPYPFDTAPLDLSVPTRTVRAGAFDDESSLVRKYYEAQRETRSVTLRPN